jgi:hypothetical protein
VLTNARPPADELPVSAGVLTIATQPPAWIIVADSFRLFSTGVSFETEVFEREPGGAGAGKLWTLAPKFAAVEVSATYADGLFVSSRGFPGEGDEYARLTWLSHWGFGINWWLTPRPVGPVVIEWEWPERSISVRFDVTLPDGR